MDRATAHFIETMGLALESDGLPRIAGRIFGLLLVSEDPRSLDDLAAELKVSKADRRDYYQVPRDLFSHTMAQRLARWQRFHEAVTSARTNLPIQSPEVLKRLEEYGEAYAHMSRIIRDALARWQASRRSRMSQAGVSG